MVFQTKNVVDRYHIYKAVGIAEQGGSLDDPVHVAAHGIRKLHEVLQPNGEADGCQLVENIYVRLWSEAHLQHCRRNDMRVCGDSMNSAFTPLADWLSAQGIRMQGKPSNRKLLALYLDGRFREAVQSSPERSEIERFLSVCYTLGNFIPVPPPFQHRGTGRSKDYWDLALACIFNYYMNKEGGAECIGAQHGSPYSLDWLLPSHQAVIQCQSWLDSFQTWDAFVEKNYLSAFVDADSRCKKPKQLWKGHFTGQITPDTEQALQFFRQTSKRIVERGKRMVSALNSAAAPSASHRESLDGSYP